MISQTQDWYRSREANNCSRVCTSTLDSRMWSSKNKKNNNLSYLWWHKWHFFFFFNWTIIIKKTPNPFIMENKAQPPPVGCISLPPHSQNAARLLACSCIVEIKLRGQFWIEAGTGSFFRETTPNTARKKLHLPWQVLHGCKKHLTMLTPTRLGFSVST